MKRSAALASFVTLALYAHAAHAVATVGGRAVDAEGVEHYPVTSSYQGAAATELRVLRPTTFSPMNSYRFLYVLPVEAGRSMAYGDGLDHVRRLGLHDRYGLIVVAPSFNQLPWYADHPSNAAIQQERFLVEDIVAVVDDLYPQTHPQRLLLGFSKSGMGAVSTILRHPDLFDAAAAWDGPLNTTSISGLPGGAPIFGTQANVDQYAIPRALPTRSAPFIAERRLWIGGYGGWRPDMIASHMQMTALGVLHDWEDGPPREHRWDSGWVEGAVAALDVMAPLAVERPDAAIDVASDAAIDATVAIEASTSDVAVDRALDDVAASADAGMRDRSAECGCRAAGSSSERKTRWIALPLALTLAALRLRARRDR